MILSRTIHRVPIHRYQPEVAAIYPQSDINAGLVAQRSVQHVDKFVRDCKEAGVWTKLQLCLPFIGNTLSVAIRDLVAGAATNAVNFVAGDYSEATGLTGNGTIKYLDLALSATALGVTGHLSFYQRVDNAATGARMCLGASGVSDQFWLGSGNPSTNVAARYGGLTSVIDNNPMIRGFYYAERKAATDLKVYRNNTQLAILATSITPALPALNFFGWAENSNGAAASFNATTGSFLSIGADMTAQQRSDFYTIVQTLQTNLGRAV